MTIGVPPENLQVEVLPPTDDERRRLMFALPLQSVDRRLSAVTATYSSNAFRLHVIVVLTAAMQAQYSPQENVNKILAAALQSGGGGVVQSIITALEAAGVPVPSNLAKATLAQSGTPQYIAQFVHVVPDWIVTAWSECSTQCGDGTQTRKVSCSTGVCSKAEPAAEQSCSEDAGCPISIFVWIGIGIGAFVLCCMACLNYCRIKMKPQKSGQKIINLNPEDEHNKERTKFTVIRPAVMESMTAAGEKGLAESQSTRLKDLEAGNDVEEGAVAPTKTSLNTAYDYEGKKLGSKAPDDGRIHVVWEIDHEKVQLYFQENPVEVPEQESTSASSENPQAGAGMLPLMDDDGNAVEGNALFGGPVDDQPDQLNQLVLAGQAAELPEIIPFMKDGERAEYYSVTHKTWMAATIHWTALPGTKFDPTPYVTYNATLGHGRFMNGVSWSVLRTPFEYGEPIEIYSKRGGGTWLPAIINGRQVAGATTFGYQVLLCESNQVLERISTTRIRLRFPPGQDVLYYTGWERGWVSAKVADTAVKEGTGAPDLDVVRALDTIAKAGKIDQPDRPEKAKGEKKMTTEIALEEQEEDLDIKPWVEVPVLHEMSNGLPESVPSWTLRIRSKWHDYERKRIMV